MTQDKWWFFKSLKLARSFANRTRKPHMIFNGPDGQYVVVSMAEGEKLIRMGHEPIK